MKNSIKNVNEKKRFSIKALVLTVTSLPLLIACVIIVFFSAWTLDTGIEAEALDGLKAVASGATLAMESIHGDYSLQGEDVYVGDVNITQNVSFVDSYASKNEAEISFFYGDVRRVTTLKNENGQRIVGTSADSEISSKVLGSGEEYESTHIKINGEEYYGVYLPVKDKTSGKIIGMMFAGKPRTENTKFILVRINFIIAIAVVVYILCIVLSTIVTKKKMLEPLAKLSEVARKIAKGDIQQNIVKESNDEFGDLMDDFAAMMENISSQARITEKVADGDLTLSCQPASEQDVMGKAIKKMLRDNNKNLSVIKDAATRMASGANEVASASNSLAQGTTEQASAIEEITASIEEIANGAKINADDAKHANELVQNTKEGAIRGNDQMKKMIDAMQDINDSSENISKIMKVIDDIAFQTNILALNASVEAARAGVHGKGFAVVADEVRNLASKSAEAAKDSAEMIEDSIRKVEIGSKLAVETASALEEILESVENIAGLVSNIANASVNQASSVGQVNAGISQIADVVQTNSATSQQCAAASSELSGLAGQLQHAVSKYKLITGRARKSSFEDEIPELEENKFVDNESIISLESDFGKY